VKNIGFAEFVVLAAAMMSTQAIAIDAMLPAFPVIVTELNIGNENHVQWIVTAYMFGLGCGQLIWGVLSDRFGRRRAMTVAAIAGVAIVPLWVYPSSLIWLTAGAFMMQFMVQGAWGVIPAHLAELSPPEVRGIFTGLAYQLGVLFAANAAFVEALLAVRMSYANVLAIVAAIVLVGDAIVIALGHERKGHEL